MGVWNEKRCNKGTVYSTTSTVNTVYSYKYFRVVVNQSAIVNDYEITNFSDFNFDIKGGGGTQFSPVFEYLADEVQKYQDALLVYFTDGGGETSLTVKPITDKVLWVITDGPESNLSLGEPYGEVRSLLDDKDFVR